MDKRISIAIALVVLVVVGVLIWDNYGGTHQGYAPSGQQNLQPAASLNTDAAIQNDLKAEPDAGQTDFAGLDAQIQKL